MTPADIAKQVHECRKRSGLSQNELAKLAGVGKTVVFDIEKGKATVQLNSLLKVLDILNIKMIFDLPFINKKED